MRIIKEQLDTLAKMTEYRTKKLVADEQMNRLLNRWFLFDEKETEIQRMSGESLETVLYSKYYWCTQYKNHYTKLFGADVGLEQQQYRIIEEINQKILTVDWKLIQTIEEENDQN